MDIEELRADWHKATEKDKPHDAIKALVQLEKLEPKEPRWSQRLAESYRRTGQTKDAVDAFARAFERYFSQGFLPRAIAMAKLVSSLDAARGDLLEKSLPKGGPGVPPPLPFGRPVGKTPPPPVATMPARANVGSQPAPAKDVVKPPPLPAGAGPKPPRVAPYAVTGPAPTPARPPPPPPPPPPPVSLPSLRISKPMPLARATDAEADEVRFDDAPDSSIEISLVDFSHSDVVTLDVEEDAAPPTRQRSDAPPASVEPSYDAYATMATFRLFASLSREALLAMAHAAEVVEFVPGAMIIVRDERAFALYAIVSGAARVVVAGSPEIRLSEGDIFGEASLLDEGQRQADVRAETPLMTLRIEKRALDDVTKEHPEVEDVLFDLLARRLIMNLMNSSKLFSSFDTRVRLELAQKFEVRRAEAGTVIAERGRRSDGLYVLLAGNVMAEPEGGVATRVARGTAFGHASLLGARTAEVTLRAASEAVLLRMPAAGFASLAAQYPPVLAHLAETAHEPIPTSERDP